MSLEHILLGMLRDPATGYELRRDFDEGPRHFWSAQLSQIYPILQRMEKRGWLTSREEPSERGPTRRVYRRTPAGTRALHKWLSGEPDLTTERLAHIGQLVFLGELRDPQRTLHFLTQLRERFATVQNDLEDAERELRSVHQSSGNGGGPMNDDDFHELLCLRLGALAHQGRVAGCDECIKLVKQRLRRKERSHVRP